MGCHLYNEESADDRAQKLLFHPYSTESNNHCTPKGMGKGDE